MFSITGSSVRSGVGFSRLYMFYSEVFTIHLPQADHLMNRKALYRDRFHNRPRCHYHHRDTTSLYRDDTRRIFVSRSLYWSSPRQQEDHPMNRKGPIQRSIPQPSQMPLPLSRYHIPAGTKHTNRCGPCIGPVPGNRQITR
jgi:hypothetical protein